eukprot:1986729-Pyramimonas_sp.AAC.1
MLAFVQLECLHVALISSDETNEFVVHEFYQVPRCCLDADASLKLRDLFPDADRFLQAPGIRQALKLWASKARVSNMHIERLLAQLKRNAVDIPPYRVERFLSEGYITQFVAQHLANGGKDPR